MSKVTVIVPVYNVEKYLPACLDSVLEQSLRDIEVIAIDDASPDRCGEILDEYARRDSRVRVIHLPENHQQGYGRNRGLEAAQSKYVYFLDSDDMITPTALEELYELAERDSLDGIFFDSQVLVESEDLWRHASGYLSIRKGEYPDAVLKGSELLDLFVKEKEWLVFVQREFWRRDYLLKRGIAFPESTEHEDELFSFEAILLAERVRYVRRDFFVHRYRANSVMTRKPHPKDFHGYFTIFSRMSEFVRKNGLSGPGVDDCRIHMYNCMMNFLNDFETQADPDDWFSPEDRIRYDFFQDLRSIRDLAEKASARIYAPLKPYNEIWLYGAGRVARSVYQRMTVNGHNVTKFIVTERADNQETLNKRPVITAAELPEQPEDCIVVVAMAKELHKGPADILESKGYRYFLYAKDEMIGPFGGEKRD